ncbi:MAG: hypothetical protein SWO11_12255 [Thermodesulfobacteriota bacterium]|nr:hypothetical protein [Thermodesulfobacteriota bacterium]
MPRQTRLDTLGVLHHVMIRGIEGIDIFCDNEDRRDFKYRINSLVMITSTKIVAWVFMPKYIYPLLFIGVVGFLRLYGVF